MSEKRKYDSTVARIAGNVLSGMVSSRDFDKEQPEDLAKAAVFMARAIVAETIRTEPAPADDRT